MKRHPVVYNGKHYDTLLQLANDLNLPYNSLLGRIVKMKWDIVKAIETPFVKNKTHRYYHEYIDHKGNKYNQLKDLLAHYHIKQFTFLARISRGWSIEEALTRPVRMRGKSNG